MPVATIKCIHCGFQELRYVPDPGKYPFHTTICGECHWKFKINTTTKEITDPEPPLSERR